MRQFDRDADNAQPGKNTINDGEGNSFEGSAITFWGRLDSRDFYYLDKYDKLITFSLGRRCFFGFISAFCLAASAIFAFHKINEYLGWALVVASPIVFGWWVFHPHFTRFGMKIWYLLHGHRLKQTRVTLSDSRVEILNEDIDNFMSWTSIQFVVVAPEGILFLAGDAPIFWLPIRLFSNDSIMHELLRFDR